MSLQTDDFEELREAATDWDQQYYQMSPGRFEGGIDLTQVGSRQIFRERWGRKIRYQGTAPHGAFGFALPFDQPGTANWVGKPTCADTVILQAPGQEAHFVSSGYWDALVFGISEEEVHSIVAVLTGDDDVNDGLHGTVTLARHAADRLRQLGRDFLYESASASPEDERQISRYSEHLVTLFLWELVNAQENRVSLIDPTKTADTVRKATELVLSERTSVMGLMEICTRLDVSLRALHYAFQDVTEMPPATWLRRIRLNQVHKALLRSSPDDILVKQVAIDHGFFHLGHFSRQYERLFGCLPSQTLQSA